MDLLIVTLRQNLYSLMEDRGSCAWFQWKEEFGHRRVLNKKIGILWHSECLVKGMPMFLGVLESGVLPYVESVNKWLLRFPVSAF